MKRASRQHRLISIVCPILLFAIGAGSAEAGVPAAERATLLNFYASTNGASWRVSTNWNGASGTECTWYGVTCNGSGSSVTALNLPGNNLSGSLPADLASLTNLTYFFVNGNQLTGAIPSLAGLTSLSSFYANNNQLTGAIPPLTGLASLVYFYVNDNQLTGTIPPLTGLAKLGVFSASNNRLTGSLPAFDGLAALTYVTVEHNLLDGTLSSFSGAPGLIYFYARHNQLTGGIPALAGLTSLVYFYVDDNQLTGSLPSLAGLTNLTVFDASTNQLTGTLPDLGGNANLTYFSVSTNQLSGAIPALGGATKLSEFYANNNQLSGTLPALTGLTAMRYFSVANNQLTGSLPPLTGLTGLTYFSTRRNQLTGTLPDLAGLTGLIYFYVNDNKLTGSIPSLAGLTNLGAFDVSTNQLTGAIPALTGLAKLSYFYVNNNSLTGPVPAVPSPNSLAAGGSSLCPNSLDQTADSAWDAATGQTPWYAKCGAQVPNYQGLWWNAAESGWGINFAHQGDRIFATWYTYDTAGRAWWLTMLAERTTPTGNAYTGAISVDSGPPFNNFTGTAASTAVGSGTLTFADANSGSFTYTVNGVTQTKAITRYDLGSGPQVSCTYSATTPNFAAATNYQDLWWTAGEPGWGVNFAQQGDAIFATWYTYNADHTPLWLSALVRRQGASNVYVGAMSQSSGSRFDAFDPAQRTADPVGTATLTFADGANATFGYSVTVAPFPGPVTQSKAITRFPFAANGGTLCQSLAGPQYRASAATPFTDGCDLASPTGALYTNAEVEPYLSVNPTNPANLIGVWQQDRWSDGGARGLVTGTSTDGGRTWSRSMAPFTRCSGGTPGNGGDYPRGSDPWVAIGPDGIAYQIAIAFDGADFAAGSVNAVLASRSTDGGQTWSAPVTLIRDGASAFNDKDSIAADPTAAGYAYAVWDRLLPSGRGPTYFSRTVDGGLTWETPRAIYDPGGTSQTINNQTVVLTDGTLVTFFTRLSGPSATLMVIRSSDKGVTWSAPFTVSDVQSIGVRDPDSARLVRDGSNLGAIAAGPGGMLVAVWQDARFSGGVRDGVALSRSADGGLTWSAPVQVNRDASVAAFVPGVTVRSDGAIGVAYYDFRSNTPDPATLPTDYWLARSSDGVTWTESRVAGPFDLANAPFAGGLFLGDYQSLASIGGELVPFYAAVNDGDAANRTDIFASLVTSAGAAARTPAAQGHGLAEPTYRANTASPLPITPELVRQFADSVARTKAWRRAGGLPQEAPPPREP